ncbi:MAG: hypothetical protein R3Y28_03215 [Candidatus Gastranaerophilales bacterium]
MSGLVQKTLPIGATPPLSPLWGITSSGKTNQTNTNSYGTSGNQAVLGDPTRPESRVAGLLGDKLYTFG